MPPKVQPKCIQCEKNDSPMWRNTDLGQLCQECYDQNSNQIKTEPSVGPAAAETENTSTEQQQPSNGNNNNGNSNNSTTSNPPPPPPDEKKLRKSTRATRFKTKSGQAGQTGKNLPKGRSRRNIFKKTPFKTPIVQASTHTVECLFYKGSYIQVGDIVSLMDADHNVYYAQIRGLLVDTYCEKSAFLTWLIPTQVSPDPNESFDPSTYLIGPDEEQSRKLSCLEFVMHAPSSYYHDKTTPFPPPDSMDYDTKPGGYIWTNLHPVDRPNKNKKEFDT
ncbi:GATA zinc finger domain-containing protein 1 [Eupeodes corollae]|uniref:GATA zinc finger domain-containing protein 1 n=1 Tax=Eupeodes corollae TaxID=290404 RepID=UPI00248F7235|nr:GATA zinc finger domain-containing protein 1 [Eupeodes corollae]